MNESGHTIFRAEALRRRAESRDKAVLPRFVSPRTFLALWLSLTLVAAAGMIAWFARVPIFATGPVVAVKQQGQPFQGEVVGMMFMPAQLRASLVPGQTVFLDLAGAGSRVPRPILAVEPEILSVAAARGRLSLDPVAAGTITEPAVAVLIALAPFPSGLPASAYVGSVGRSQVQVGSRRLLSLVPLVGPLLGG